VDLVKGYLEGAGSSIKIAMFEAFYDSSNPNAANSQIVKRVRDAYVNRGVDLYMLLDNPRYFNHTIGDKYYTNNNIPLKLDKDSGSLERKHVKSFLIDDQILVIGSHNWNWDSTNSAQDYSIIIKGNPTMVEEWKLLFKKIYNDGQNTCRNGPCPSLPY
jgi:hypothetical protein